MKVIVNIVLWKYESDENCHYFTLLLSENACIALLVV